MEYQKIINVLGSTPNQRTKFRTKAWVEMNDGSYGVKLVVKSNLKLQC